MDRIRQVSGIEGAERNEEPYDGDSVLERKIVISKIENYLTKSIFLVNF